METYKIAGFWRRVIALVYDSLIVVSILFLGGLIAVLLATAVWGKQAMEDGILFENNLFRIFLLLLWFGYYALSWMKGGQTLGMKPWRMYVFDKAGKTINLKQSAIRFATGFAGLGLLTIPFLANKVALQDMASSSQTLFKPKPAKS
jgi:uncharacterized RDD family membrane protein YckC